MVKLYTKFVAVSFEKYHLSLTQKTHCKTCEMLLDQERMFTKIVHNSSNKSILSHNRIYKWKKYIPSQENTENLLLFYNFIIFLPA